MLLIMNIVPAAYPAYTFLQFKSLCETEGYYKIYDTVELGPEHWDEKGYAKFLIKKNNKYVDYEVNEVLFRAEDHSVEINLVVNHIKIKIFSSENNRELADYSEAVWWPERFTGMSYLYKNLKMRTCSETRSGKRMPGFSTIKEKVFIRGNSNE